MSTSSNSSNSPFATPPQFQQQPPNQPTPGFPQSPYQYQQGPQFPGAPPEKRGCGCGGWAMGCLGLILASFLVCGGGAYLFFLKLPDLAQSALTNAINESDLPPEDKAIIHGQIARVRKAYDEGKITQQKVKQLMENLQTSPLLPLAGVLWAQTAYVEPSGLTEEEKNDAILSMQRVARGVYEKKISSEALEQLMQKITAPDANGQSRPKDKLTDPELKEFVAECKRLADTAAIPLEPFHIDIGNEVKKLIDSALNENDPDPPMIELE